MKMQWIIGIVLVGIFINLIVLYYLYFNLSTTMQDDPLSISSPTTIISKIIEREIVSSDSGGRVVVQTAPVATSSACPDCRKDIDVLESSVSALDVRVTDLEKSSGSTAIVRVPESVGGGSGAAVKEITIPFGSGGTSSKEWIDIPGMNAYIDTTKYAVIDDIRFEAVLRIPNAQGWVHARLYNESDSRPVWESEVISETDEAILKQSIPLDLATGNKLYQVQLKSTIGVQAIIDSGRVKILLQ